MPITVIKHWDPNQENKPKLEIFFTAKEAVCVLAAGQRAVMFSSLSGETLEILQQLSLDSHQTSFFFFLMALKPLGCDSQNLN